jgi:hypothetical protein
MSDLLRHRSLMIALVALVVSLVVASTVVARAVRVDEVAAAPPPTFATAAAVGKPGASTPVDVRAVVELNAFSPERSAPKRRYRLTGYDEPAVAAPVAGPQPVVLGTFVSAPDRTFATCRVGADRPRIVRVGDVLGGYTVRSIERFMVVFTTPAGDRLEVRSSR